MKTRPSQRTREPNGAATSRDEPRRDEPRQEDGQLGEPPQLLLMRLANVAVGLREEGQTKEPPNEPARACGLAPEIDQFHLCGTF